MSTASNRLTLPELFISRVCYSRLSHSPLHPVRGLPKEYGTRGTGYCNTSLDHKCAAANKPKTQHIAVSVADHATFQRNSRHHFLKGEIQTPKAARHSMLHPCEKLKPALTITRNQLVRVMVRGRPKKGPSATCAVSPAHLALPAQSAPHPPGPRIARSCSATGWEGPKTVSTVVRARLMSSFASSSRPWQTRQDTIDTMPPAHTVTIQHVGTIETWAENSDAKHESKGVQGAS